MGKRILIINADDLGYDPEVTRGIFESMREGIVTSTTFMVNTPHSESAAREAQGLAIGLHLNLARHEPLSARFPKELLERGEFVESRAHLIPASAAREETLAQLDWLEALLKRPATHVDVHKHLHRHPQILEGLILAAKERKLPVRSLDEAMRTTLRGAGVRTPDHFIGEAGKEAFWTEERFAALALKIPEGVTELMCHPGYRPSTVKSGYSEQREVELKCFASRTAHEQVNHAGILRATFRELASSD